MSDKKFQDLLTDLRVLGDLNKGYWISTLSDNHIEGTYSNSWWNTISDVVRLETFNCTHKSLKVLYCANLPEYIEYLTESKCADTKYKVQDLLSVCEKAIKGVNNLKETYSYAYQTDNGGVHDQKFETIINSYAKIQIETIRDLLNSPNDPYAAAFNGK